MWEQRHISEVSIVTLCTYFPTAQYNETKFHLLIFKQEVLLAAVSFFNSLNEEGNRSALEIFKSKQEVFKFAVNRCSTKNYFYVSLLLINRVKKILMHPRLFDC